jgi:hypothetical protein
MMTKMFRRGGGIRRTRQYPDGTVKMLLYVLFQQMTGETCGQRRNAAKN